MPAERPSNKPVETRVLHYKSRFLNPSETFIERLVTAHETVRAQGMCLRRLQLCPGFPVHSVPPAWRPAFWVNFLFFHVNLPLPFYRRTLRKVRPHVLHAHFGYDGFKVLGLARKRGIPLVVSFYGSDVSRLPDERGWKRRFEAMVDGCAAVVAASEHMKEKLVSLGFDPAKVHVVYFGLDPERFAFRESYALQGRMMMVGRMVEKKGFETAIRGVASLRERGGRTPELDLYGDGPLRASLQALVGELGLDGQVRFHGMRGMEDVLRAHGRSDLLLAPSTTASDGDEEGLPNTILEAMSCGTPVVSTPHAAIPEVVRHGETGFLVPERAPAALGDTLEAVYAGRFDLDAIRRRAHQTILHQHTQKSMVRKIEAIYHHILSPDPPSHEQARIP